MQCSADPDPEHSADSTTDPVADPHPGPHIVVEDGLIRSVDTKTGEVIREEKAPLLGKPSIDADGIRKRDAFVESCVAIGMTIEQIRRFSGVLDHPISTYGQTWDICERLGLLKQIRRRGRQSLHQQCIMDATIRIGLDAKDRLMTINSMDSEHKIGFNSRIRADMRFMLDERLYYLEVQASSLSYVGWHQKLSKYNAYRTKSGRLFKVLIVFDERSKMGNVVDYARAILKKKHGRILFLFSDARTLFKPEINVISDAVWKTHEGDLVSLLHC